MNDHQQMLCAFSFRCYDEWCGGRSAIVASCTMTRDSHMPSMSHGNWTLIDFVGSLRISYSFHDINLNMYIYMSVYIFNVHMTIIQIPVFNSFTFMFFSKEIKVNTMNYPVLLNHIKCFNHVILWNVSINFFNKNVELYLTQCTRRLPGITFLATGRVVSSGTNSPHAAIST